MLSKTINVPPICRRDSGLSAALLPIGLVVFALGAAKEAVAQAIEEIVVTAQKREQSANDVGMSITAVTGEQLARKGVTSPEDLIRVAPAFTVTTSQFDFPTYTLRGVGFYDSSLTASPTVSVYVDQVPLPYPSMTRGALFDLERVEVLKGPQGTLFGQNSTGGTINYIAAKPTETFSAGGSVSYGRFGEIQGTAHLSGPVTDGIGVRVAVRTEQGEGRQKSATRSDELGSTNFVTGRFILEAEPADGIRLSLNLNGWTDKSDTLAPQVIDVLPVVPSVPVPPGVNVLPSLAPRVADWTPGLNFERDDEFYQASLRAEWDLNDSLTLVSTSAYQHYDRYALVDGDGSPAVNLHTEPSGNVKSFFQEVRAEGSSFEDRLMWILGGTYQNDTAHDNQVIYLAESTGAVTPFGRFDAVINDADTSIDNWAAFAHGEFWFNDALSLLAGIRYTETRHDYDACSLDTGSGDLSSIFAAIQVFALGVPATTAPGECVTLRDDTSAAPSELLTTARYYDELEEDNVSWRVGVNWKPFATDALLYANVSRGFKSGSFPIVSAQLSSQLSPATQEKLTAYEVGFKAPLADRTLQLNGAAFYYDYTDKQLRGRIQTFFGQLEKLVNIPQSEIRGGELELLWYPIEPFTLTTTASYIRSEIENNPDGSPYLAFPQRTHGSVPVSGEAFPYTPEWTLAVDGEYRWRVASGLEAFVGAAATYQSRTKSGLESADPGDPLNVGESATDSYNDPLLNIPSYLLLDLRAGIERSDGRWSLSVWGKNVTNEYYRVNVLKTQDTMVRYPGEPATYGVTLGLNL